MDMSEQPGGRRHYRIYSQVTGSAFLHVEDVLDIGKLRLFAGRYQRGQGASITAYHYLDLDDARLLFTDLAAGGVPITDEKDEAYVEYKGSGEGIPTSRVLKIQVQPERVFIELSYGPGERMGQGAIRPVRGAERQSVSVALTWLEARRLALAVLAHLAAWEAATFHARIAAGLAQQLEEVTPATQPEPPASPPVTAARAEEPIAEPAEEPPAVKPAAAGAPTEEPTPVAEHAPEQPAQAPTERADATAYWQLANTEAARRAVEPAQIKEWALKAQQYKRWDLAIRRLKEAIASSQASG